MNNEPRNFYLEEEKYEKSIIEAKELIQKIMNIDIVELNEKVKTLDNNVEYSNFIDLFKAIIGNKTNKFYYCDGSEDLKYYGLKEGSIYNIDKIHPDLQKNIGDGKKLNLQARAMLAEKFIIVVNELTELFEKYISKKGKENLHSYITFEDITKLDIEQFKIIKKYLETIINKAGRLKILVAEKDLEKHEIKPQKNFFNKIIDKLVKKEK